MNASSWGIPGTNARNLSCSQSSLSLFWRQSSMACWKVEGRWEGKNVDGSILLWIGSLRLLSLVAWWEGEKTSHIEWKNQTSYPQHWMLDGSGVMFSKLWRNRTEDLEFYTKEENKSSVSEGVCSGMDSWPLLCSALYCKALALWAGFLKLLFRWLLVGSSSESIEGIKKPVYNSYCPYASSKIWPLLCLLCGSSFFWVTRLRSEIC